MENSIEKWYSEFCEHVKFLAGHENEFKKLKEAYEKCTEEGPLKMQSELLIKQVELFKNTQNV